MIYQVIVSLILLSTAARAQVAGERIIEDRFPIEYGFWNAETMNYIQDGIQEEGIRIIDLTIPETAIHDRRIQIVPTLRVPTKNNSEKVTIYNFHKMETFINFETLEKALTEAKLLEQQSRKKGCMSHVLVDSAQENKCWTPFYTPVDAVYRRVTCEDMESHDEFADDEKIFLVTQFEYCKTFWSSIFPKNKRAKF